MTTFFKITDNDGGWQWYGWRTDHQVWTCRWDGWTSRMYPDKLYVGEAASQRNAVRVAEAHYERNWKPVKAVLFDTKMP